MLQLRGFRTQGQEEMVIHLYSPFLDPAFASGYTRIQAWEFRSFEDFEARASPDDWAALYQVNCFFAMMGLLYKRGLTSLDLLDDLLAGPSLMYWNKVAPLIHDMRERTNAPDLFQWAEYLARALDGRLTALGEAHPAFIEPHATTTHSM